MKQFVTLFRQMRDVVCINAVATNDHFIITFSSHLAHVDSNVDVMAVSTIYEVIVDIVLCIYKQRDVECRPRM